jgi:VIT1/CCC1 family predicted Fe2+/Mn2+ transporter
LDTWDADPLGFLNGGKMLNFIQRHLDPSTRLGEVLFGLIMALGITGAVQFGLAEANHRRLLIAVLGCNIAWGIVDGVMFVLLALFERGRKTRIVEGVLSSPTDEAALERIHQELGNRLEPLTTPEERRQVYIWILELARRSSNEPPRIHREDILGGIAVGLLILVATLPVVVPFLLFSNATTAVRTSNLVTLAMLFGIGWWWGRMVGANALRIAVGVMGVGLTLVLITIALGG